MVSRPPHSGTSPRPRSTRPAATGRDLVVALSPFEQPDERIVAAAERAGALGLLDLGRHAGPAHTALAGLARRLRRPHGVRVPVGCPLPPGELPAAVDTVLLADPEEFTATARHRTEGRHDWSDGGRRRIWAEVTSPQEAAAACAAGAEALVVRGHESGGRVGELTTCVLLQCVLADPGTTVPVLAAGGIGPHTAAAAVAGGAAGVLLDSQLALTTEGEQRLPRRLAAALRAMDGSESVLVDGHRVLTRPDLPTDPLPVGQDGAFAARLAARHRTIGGILTAVRSAVTGHLAAAARTRPLAPRPDARHLPVAQGPMTRVSDEAAFAAAVAAEGGLPFLALAVMDGEQVRRLLAETAERLGERPWGVGLLGFAPPDLRRAQLAAVAEFAPAYALIAGGRPAQSAPLEAAGTRTYLHVPSPGLLERYLTEGARRFVFEGQECGGHTGPRASFPLWEEQIERLLTYDREHRGTAEEFDVLFAGGIHDARSAAMAAAAAAPLAERGARIGVLMGTAYLFTEEAVATGAVRPAFQDTALACERTVLLRTAPGHATRCAETAYAAEFAATERRLAADGVDPRTRWEELERRNLGRLRIASKGLRHTDGGPPAPVGEPDQLREGLYMLGQAATARSATTSLAALHADVTEGASALLDARAKQLRPPAGHQDQQAAPLDIAIVGMACCYPGAPDTARYWSNVVAGVDSVTEVPAERWDAATYHDPDPARAGERTPSRWGGFLPAIPFDALAHGIPPASLTGIEPVQLLALEAAAKALADAGYADRDFDRARTGVVFGAEAGTELAGAYGLRALHPAYLGDLPPALDAELPRLTEDSFPGVLANVIAGRIASRLDLGGANCTVDAACASSLAALDLACRQLRDRDADMVLCGGADVHNGINDYLMFASVRALSPTGRCRPFDAAADGIALGEGVGALVLKRVEDAERDGDRIYAVVKAVGSASDGRSLGLTAPRPEGQRRALERAYRRAGISPAQVGLLEAHGTGTVVGDATELAVLTDLFQVAGAAPGSCTLGSVKSQIGHTKCAAGLAGLIKTAHAVHAGVRPPTLHLTRPGADTGPFRFEAGGARPWTAPVERRVAGVSAFGFGGTNYHAVLAGYPGADEPAHTLQEWPAELFCFRGADRAAAAAAVDRLAARLADNDAAGRPWPLRDLAAETAAAAADAPIQVCVVAEDLDRLAARLDAARRGTATDGVYPRRQDADPGLVAFLFPGQGSQRTGMLGELFVAFPALRGLLDDADPDCVAAMFPPTAFTAEQRRAQSAALTDTRVAQPALGLASVAAHRLLTTLGVRPDCAAGHSFGELTALWAAGAYDTEALLRLSDRRAAAIVRAAGDDPGAMAAVAAAPARVRELTRGTPGVVVANHNAPEQSVISGPADAVEQAVAALCAAGTEARRIPVACAFHSPRLEPAGEELAQELRATRLSGTAFPVWSGATARPYGRETSAIRDTLAGQVAAPVRFVDQIEDMYAAGVRTFVEAGPGRVLTGLVGRILGERPHTAVALDVPGEPGLARLPHVLARLAAAGVPVDPEALFRGRTRALPQEAPRRPGWLVDGHLVRTADGACLPGGLRPARRVATAPADGPAAPGEAARQHVVRSVRPVAAVTDDGPAAPGEAARQHAVLEYLRGARELVLAQRDVVLRYLGETDPAAPRTAPAAPRIAPVSERPLAPYDGADLAGTDLAGTGPAGAHTGAGTGAAPAPDARPARLTPDQLLDAVREIIHTRTGYPREMLDAGLDLEADLSVDSIKRVEIIGALADRIGLPQDADGAAESVVEELSRVKTISGIVERITAATPEPAPEPPTPPEALPAPPAAPAPATSSAAGRPPTRYLVDVAPLGPPASRPPAEVVAGAEFAVVEDGQGVALALTALLESHGARVRTVPAERLAQVTADGVVDLSALRAGRTAVLPGQYAGLRTALTGGVRRLLLATAAGGTFGQDAAASGPDPLPGAGLRGFARAAALEYPDVLIRAVDIDPKDRPERIAAHLLAELCAPGEPVVVGRTNGTRTTLRTVRTPLPQARTAADRTPLGPGSVVLLTGGARGITARTALALARTHGCHIELLGRTPRAEAPEAPEDPALAHAPDRITLRAALISQGLRRPAEIEAAATDILARREIAATLAALEPHAASVRYHAADVTDAAAVRAVARDIRDRHGRLDGIVHGAGTLEDKLLRDKDPDSFARVFATKVDGARHLLAAAGDDTGFLVLFGSVAGVFGNRGQADYAAANDALDTLARAWSARTAHRVLAVDWGPWAATGGGMVTPELARAYARRGIPLLDPDAAVAALLDELAHGTAPQVVLAAEATGEAAGDE
ncbi:SDR family NAD(P)-dependent oxidoreductase [Streptomyces sp. NPDC058989]|uniref:SDR family NAD(P)-dependent oxidoreductase n=1 Tax=Streptomyces sp. NPDC058989 TaxID=3346686 RepID=UPI0036ACF3E9